MLDTEGPTLGTREGKSEGIPEREGAQLGADEIEGLWEAEGNGLSVGRITVGSMDGIVDGILVPFVFPTLPLLALRSKRLLAALTVLPF